MPREEAVTAARRRADAHPVAAFVMGHSGVELGVIDSGIGIPEAEHAKIFDAFYQVDGSSTREHGGTRLGLSIVRRLVEAHGGHVRVESTPGKGAAFYLAIPEPEES